MVTLELQHYIFEQSGKDFLIKFKRANFDYTLDSNDKIFIEGDLVRLWVEKNQI